LSSDVHGKETACGSSNLEYPIIAWFVLLILTLITAACLLYSKLTTIVGVAQSMSDWWRASSSCLSTEQHSSGSSELFHTRASLRYLEYECSMAVVVVTMYVLVVMVSLIGMKLQGTERVNSLYQVQYLLMPKDTQHIQF
jgi:hypothetical protein